MVDKASAHALLDHAQDKIVLLDETGTFTYANQAVEHILGHDPETLLGETAFSYVHPDDVPAVTAAFEETIESDDPVETRVEYRFEAADGSWVWLESRMSNVTPDELDGYVVTSRDITERVDAQRELRETVTRLEELAGATGDVLWMFNADWSEILFVNPAYEEVYGQPTDVLYDDPQSFLDVIHPEDVPDVLDAMEELSNGQSVDIEYRVNPKTDYSTWAWVQAEPIVEDGEVVRITGFSRDVTDRRRRERQLYVMDTLLRHNLRNDLTLMLGNADLIAEDFPDATDRTDVIRRTGESLLESADKEREIIELLIDDTSPEHIDIAAIVEEAASTMRARFPDATIDVDVPPSLEATGMAELVVAIEELIDNAIQHTERTHPTVTITTTTDTDADLVSLTIADQAPAIPAIEAGVLTGEYEMNDVYHSSGLGLWLVHWVVDLADGTITVTKRDGGGNEITIRLDRPAN